MRGEQTCPYCGETFVGPNLVNHMPCDEAPETPDTIDRSTDYGGVDAATRRQMGVDR